MQETRPTAHSLQKRRVGFTVESDPLTLSKGGFSFLVLKVFWFGSNGAWAAERLAGGWIGALRLPLRL